MDSDITLYRRRFIPDELTPLTKDRLLHLDEDIIITAWDTLKPRPDFASGLSVYYRKEGFKISRHQRSDGSFSRWYCDIIMESMEDNRLIFSDLLIDVIIHSDGTVQVVDLDEAAEALEQGLITADMLARALHSTNKLLNYIYQDRFSELTNCISGYIQSS